MTLARLAHRWLCRTNPGTSTTWAGIARRSTHSSAQEFADRESALQIAILNSFARWVRAEAPNSHPATSTPFSFYVEGRGTERERARGGGRSGVDVAR